MIGYVAIVLALVVTAMASFAYFNTHLAQATKLSTRKSSPKQGNGDLYYRIAALLATVGAAYLLYLILSDNFAYAYVFSYSSRQMPLAYKFSAFWAGQEGSFMLWLVFHVVFGLIMIRKNTAPPGTMSIYCGLQAILLILLLVKSPFMMLAELKLDGVGLNPLLQDPWMVIHPPILFLGYAGLAVPFAYGLGGLLSGKHESWIERALPWTLIAWSALGAGIFIGGFWAYKVLGWGGYWAWDPVENSSLVPWLIGGAFVHLLLVTRIRLAAVKGSYVAVIFTFILVLYGTFLTRSGILSDFSTHSFADEGVGTILAVFLMLTIGVALPLLIMRWPSLPQGETYTRVNSKEFILAAAALTLSLLGFLVLVGMSAPLLTMMLGNPQSVSTAFYNTTSLPLAVMLMLLLTVGPALSRGGNEASLVKKYWWLIVVACAGVFVGIGYGLRQPMLLITITLAFTAVVMSIPAIVGGKSFNRPGAVAHLGLGLMIMGIVISSAASQSITANFVLGESQEVFGSQITYKGKYTLDADKGLYQNFQVDGLEKYSLQPYTKLNKEGNPAAREPGIHRGMAADIYLAPIITEERQVAKEVMLKKGDQKLVEGLVVKFVDVSMAGQENNQNIRIQATLEVTKDGNMQEIRPEMIYRNGQTKVAPVKVFDTYEIGLNAVNPAEKAVSLGVRNLAGIISLEQIDVEITHKPLINLVWLGAILITIGTSWAGIRRMRVTGV
jgi:cytochrome c-type biogenesis protein CcmF